MLNSIPANIISTKPIIDYWKLFSGYKYPTCTETTDGDDLITGTILYFNEDRRIGFIKNNPNNNAQKDDLFFHIAQVKDDTEQGILLRKLLANGIADKLEVHFRLGKSYAKIGAVAAFSIELTDVGYAEGNKRLNNLIDSLKKHTGFVERFDQSTRSGRINYGSRTAMFSLDRVSDPWLRAYYNGCTDNEIKEQNVCFEISGTSATNICWHNPIESERLLYAHLITDEEITQWENYQRASAFQPNGRTIDDSYAYYPYQSLEPIDSVTGLSHEKTPLRKDALHRLLHLLSCRRRKQGATPLCP